MTSTDNLRSVVASVLRIDPSVITDETPVSKLNNSIDRAKLSRGVKAMGLSVPTGKLGPSFGEFVKSISGAGLEAVGIDSGDSGSASNHSEQANGWLPTEAHHAPPSSLKLGIDIEMVASLPEVPDIWNDDFYRSMFTGAEIARSQLHPNPRSHLTGVWCAKEALRKSNARFLTLAFSHMELGHHSNGAPFLRVLVGESWKLLQCSVSISHTDEIATAVVGWIGSAEA